MAALGGIASLVTGIPGVGTLLGAFGPMSPEDQAMKDFYEANFGLTDTGQVASGIMQGFYLVSQDNGEKLKIDIPAFSLDSPYNKKNVH